MELRKRPELSGDALHILAMGLMLCDHMWATLFPQARWLTSVGRMAYPIFAFLIAEGFAHTHSVRKYMQRLLIWAVISEVPFDLMYSGTPFYLYHQNVLWTFLIALVLMCMVERVKSRGKFWLTVPAAVGACLLGLVIGTVTMTDYYGAGVLTVLAFYLFRGEKWWQRLAQLAILWYINTELLGGLCLTADLFGRKVEILEQGIALLAFLPILLYRGRKGRGGRRFRLFCYAFYPAHMLLLYALQTLLP